MRLCVVRLIVMIAAFFAVVHARAALACTHLVNAGQLAIDLRDKGISLGNVLAETERPDIKEKFTAQELNTMRQIMRFSYTGEYSIREILEACEAGELGVPRKKK